MPFVKDDTHTYKLIKGTLPHTPHSEIDVGDKIQRCLTFSNKYLRYWYLCVTASH